MRVGFVIVGRLKSTRLKKKLLLDLAGHTVLLRMVERIQLAKSVNSVVLATSTHPQDDELAALSSSIGIHCYRGHEEDVLDRIYEAACVNQLDYIVHVTADCPLVDPVYIDKTVDFYRQTQADLITAFDLPHGTFCYGIKPSALKTVLSIKRTEKTEVWGRYFTDTDFFDVQSLPVKASHQRTIRLTLDYPEDYAVLSLLYAELMHNRSRSDFSLDDIIDYADRHTEVMKQNLHLAAEYKKRHSAQSHIELNERHEIQRAAIVGCGSIGQRHIRNLQSLGVTDIVALRTKKGATQELPADIVVTEVDSWDALYSAKPDIAIISNPSHLHMSTFNQLVGHVKGIFIEKPLSHNMEGIKAAQTAIEQYKAITFVGYNLQFHPIFHRISSIIQSGELGLLTALQAQVGQWLPDWHPNEDYRQLYVARSECGGGALLSLIHEVQMALDWCGPYDSVQAVFPASSLLPLEVDVQANLMIQHHSGAISQLHIDLLQQPMSRKGTLIFERGTIEYDFVESSVVQYTGTPARRQVIYSESEFDSNRPYVAMLDRFLSYVRQGRYRHEHDFRSAMASLLVTRDAFRCKKGEVCDTCLV